MQIKIFLSIFLLIMTADILKPFSNQTIAANSSTFFGVNEADLPEHYNNLFFGHTMNGDQQESLLSQISAFLLAKGIRSLAEKAEEVIIKGNPKAQSSTTTKTQQRGKRGKFSSKKSTEIAAGNKATKNKAALQTLLQKLADLEIRSQRDSITSETLKSLDNILTIFQTLALAENKNECILDEKDVEAMIEKQSRDASIDTADEERKMKIRMQTLHLETIKLLLVSKSHSNNKLATTFEQLNMAEEKTNVIMEAKEKMRAVIGTRMFEELELQEPLLFRIDITEHRELVRLYQQLLSSPFCIDECVEAKQHLEIRFLFGHIFQMNKEKYAAVKLRKAFKNRDQTTPKETHEKLVKLFREMDIANWEQLLKARHQNILIQIFNASDGQFKQFLNAMPGARARVHKMLGDQTPKELEEFDWDIDTMFEKLAVNYLKLAVLDTKNKGEGNKLEQLKARLNANVLVQIVWLMKTHLLMEQNESGNRIKPSSPWWSNLWNKVLLALDNIVEANIKFTELYASLLNDMLYKLRLSYTPNKEWEDVLTPIKAEIATYLADLDEARRREALNEEPLYHFESPLEKEKQAEWLGYEHRRMVEMFIGQADTETKWKLIRDLSKEQIVRLANSLCKGPNKEIELENWLTLFEEERNDELPQIPVKKEENKDESVMKQLVEEIDGAGDKFTADDEKHEEKPAEAVKLKEDKVAYNVLEEGDEEEEKQQIFSEHIDEMIQLAKLYLLAIKDESMELQRLRAKTSVDVLVQFLWVDEFYSREQTAKGIISHDWNTCGLKFVDYLHQVTEGSRDQEWIVRSAVLYGNLLYKLRLQAEKINESCELETELLVAKECKQLDQLKVWEKDDGKMRTMTTAVEPIEADAQRGWLQKEHAKYISALEKENSNFRERLAALTPSERCRLEKFMGNSGDEIVKKRGIDEDEVKNKSEETGKTEVNKENEEEEKEVLGFNDEALTMVKKGEKAEVKDVVEEMPTLITDETKKVEKAKKKKNKKKVEMKVEPTKQLKEPPPVYFECPNDDIEIPEILETPYEHLLMNIPEANLDFQKREANLDTLEWHFRKSINELLISDRNKESFAQAWKDWSELSEKCVSDLNSMPLTGIVVHDNPLTTLKEQTVCKYHNFMVQRILNNKAMTKNLRTVGFTETLIKWLLEIPISDCENSLQLNDSATKLLEYPDLQMVHSEHLDWLIRDSEELRRFFCKNDPQVIKGRLLKLINPPVLDQLEIKHPEVLKIDKMHPKMRVHLYVAHRTGTPEAQAAELRIALSLQLGQLSKWENHDFGSSNYALANAAREKIRLLKQHMFLLNRATNSVVSMRNICLMVRLSDAIYNMAMLSREAESGGNNDYAAIVRNWNDEEICQQSRWQEAAMQTHQKRFAQERQAFFAALNFKPEADEDTMYGMIEDPGNRTRLRKLSPSQFNNLFDTYDRLTITDDIQLQKQINDFLFGEDEESRLAAHLGVNFIVWIRWMEAQLDKKMKSPEADLVKGFWQEIQKHLLEKFDEIFDQNTEELIEAKGNWARVQETIADYLLCNRIKCPNSATKKAKEAFISKWKDATLKKIIEILANMEVYDEEWNEVWFEKVTIKIAVKNREELLKLLKEADEQMKKGVFNKEHIDKDDEQLSNQKTLPNFKEWLLKAFKDHPETKKRLPELIGAAGVKPVVEEMGWIRWKPKEFGLTNDMINAAEREERNLEKAENENLCEKSLDQLVKEVESVGDATTINGIANSSKKQQKASKNKGTKKNSRKLSHHSPSSVDTASSSSASNSTGTDESESLLVTQMETTQKLTGEHSSMLTESGHEQNASEQQQMSSADLVESKVDQKACSREDAVSSITQIDSVQKRRQAEATEPLLDILRANHLMGRSSSINNTLSTELDHSSEIVIKRLKGIVHDWKEEAILLFSGSYLLQLNTADSDIDCVLLLPFEEKNADDWIELYKEHFYSNQIGPNGEEVLCNLQSAERHCPNSSLYCMLCKDQGVKSLQKMFGREMGPMIHIQFHGIHFDISFVSIPKEITDSLLVTKASTNIEEETTISMSEKENGIMKVDKIIASFINWMEVMNRDVSKGMLWALLPCELVDTSLLKGKPVETFRSALLALKLWAKKHFVYGGKFGLINGPILITMLLQIFHENFQDPIPLLLAKFFHTFIHRIWNEEPVKLEEHFNEERKKYAQLDWNESTEKNDRANQFYENLSLAEEHKKLVWTVISPGFPTQNAAFNVNFWTSQVMHREFVKGFEQMDTIQKAIGRDNALNMIEIRQQWESWFDGGQFYEKYDNFVTIVCVAKSTEEMHTYCDFVERRIRLQLLSTFGDLPKELVKWMHASPEKMRNDAMCPSDEKVQLSAGKWLCTIWLVGVQLVESSTNHEDIQHILEQKHTFHLRHMEHPKEMSRLESFAEKISADFDHQQKAAKRTELKEKSLSATYFAKEELQNG